MFNSESLLQRALTDSGITVPAAELIGRLIVFRYRLHPQYCGIMQMTSLEFTRGGGLVLRTNNCNFGDHKLDGLYWDWQHKGWRPTCQHEPIQDDALLGDIELIKVSV
jgi:hypothetical protein